MAADAAWERELAEQAGHPLFVCGQVRIDLAGRALQVGVRHRGRAAMARPDDPDGVEIPCLDDAVGVDVDEVEPGVVPQWPSSRGLVCSARNGSWRSGLAMQVDLADG